MQINDWNWNNFQKVLDHPSWDVIETFYISLPVEHREAIAFYDNWLGRRHQVNLVLTQQKEFLLKDIENRAGEYLTLLEEFMVTELAVA